MATDIMNVTGTCRLTHDPDEPSTMPSGTKVLTMRVAWTTNRRNTNGEWEDYSNYGDVTVYNQQAESCSKYLKKGRQIVVTGDLRHERWQDKQTGDNRSKHVISANRVQFVGPNGEAKDADDTQDIPF